MPLIGDELRTILGMMPTRDRAGIARGTMADDAMRSSAAAESGNAEGAALMQQGGPPRPAPQAPPQIKLPPMGGPGGPPPGDIQLPADVPTAFASGSGGGGPAPPPVPQERVVASGPAAAPPAGVATRASDVMMAILEQRDRQQKMMQLVGSLGLIANAFNRNPESQAATKSSLAGMMGGGAGGGGGIGLSDVKTIQDMKDKEAAAQGAAETRTSAIGAMVRKGMDPAQAAIEYDIGKAGERLGAEAEDRAKTRKELEEIQKELEPQIDAFAKATGSDPMILRAQLKKDPQKVLDIMSPRSRADVRKLEVDTADKELDMIPKAARLKVWQQIISNPESAQAAGLTPQDVARLQDPTALAHFIDERAKKQGEYAGTQGQSAARQIREDFVKEDHKTAKTADAYLRNTGKQLGDLWNDKLVTGTFEDIRRSGILRPLATLTGKSDVDLNNTAKIQAAFSQYVVANANALGRQPTDRDAIIIEKVGGGVELEPHEMRGVISMNERNKRQALVDHNDAVEENKNVSPEMRGEFGQVRKFEMPEPSKILRDDVYAPGKNNEALRNGMSTAYQQVVDKAGTPQHDAAVAEYKNMKKAFDREFGAEMSTWYLKDQAAKAGRK